MSELLKAPIPGQSLTDEPKNYPWENPPEINDPEEAVAMHLSKLNDPEVVDNIIDLLDMGVPVKSLGESILTAAVAGGWHSIDVSLIIAPFIHEHLISIANEAGVDYKEGFEEDEEARQTQERERLAARVRKELKKTPKDKQDAGYEVAMQTLEVLGKPEQEYETLQAPAEEGMMEEEAAVQEAAPTVSRGLMARG